MFINSQCCNFWNSLSFSESFDVAEMVCNGGISLAIVSYNDNDNSRDDLFYSFCGC